jgi:hypothetical protein
VILLGAAAFEYYRYEQLREELAHVHPTQAQQQLPSNVTLCQVASMRAYLEPGYHLENGTFVHSKVYDTIIVWTLIDCIGQEATNYSFVGTFRLVPNGFNGIEAYYTPQAFTVYNAAATYEQKILLYLPSLGNETRTITVRLIILAYTNDSARIAGLSSGNITI